MPGVSCAGRNLADNTDEYLCKYDPRKLRHGNYHEQVTMKFRGNKIGGKFSKVFMLANFKEGDEAEFRKALEKAMAEAKAWFDGQTFDT